MNRTEFVQGLALLTGSVGKPMPDEQVAAWFAMLGDLTVEQFKSGIIKAIRAHQYAGFPPLGLIFRLATTHMEPEQKAVLAWSAVQFALSQVNKRDSVEFTDLVVNAALRSLGRWQDLRCIPAKDLNWLRRDFIQTYAVLYGHKLDDYLCRRLEGSDECHNRRESEPQPFRVVQVPCLTVDDDPSEPFKLSVERPTKPNQLVGNTGRQVTAALDVKLNDLQSTSWRYRNDLD